MLGSTLNSRSAKPKSLRRHATCTAVSRDKVCEVTCIRALYHPPGSATQKELVEKALEKVDELQGREGLPVVLNMMLTKAVGPTKAAGGN